jgi:hypothetical protein
VVYTKTSNGRRRRMTLDDIAEKTAGEWCLICLLVIFIFAILILLNSLLWWGVGSLFISAFNIPYTWSFLKSLALTLVLYMLKPIKITNCKGE